MSLSIKGIQISPKYEQFQNASLSSEELLVKGFYLSEDKSLVKIYCTPYSVSNLNYTVNSITLKHPILPDHNLILNSNRYETSSFVPVDYFLDGQIEVDINYNTPLNSYNSIITFNVNKNFYIHISSYSNYINQDNYVFDLSYLYLNSQEINHYLKELDLISNAGFVNRSIKLRGESSDNFSGGINGLSHISSLESKAITVNIT